MKKQTNSRQNYFMCTLLIFVLLLCAACQPTPEKEVVIQKDNYENLIDTTATPDDSIVTDSTETANESNGNNHIYWQDVFAKDFSTKKAGRGYDKHELTVTVDADIIVSEQTASVYLVEPTDFQQGFCRKCR